MGKKSNCKKLFKRVAFTLKAIGAILLGIIKPIKALVEPDDTRYRTKLKGVISDNGHLERWKDLKDDFCCAIKEI